MTLIPVSKNEFEKEYPPVDLTDIKSENMVWVHHEAHGEGKGTFKNPTNTISHALRIPSIRKFIKFMKRK